MKETKMTDQTLLGEIFDKIRQARVERRQALKNNVAAVKNLRKEVRSQQAAIRRKLQQDASSVRRSLKRFVERNRLATQRLLVNAKNTRDRYRMRLRFDSTSAVGQRKRNVQAILRSSASKRRLGELHRRRITATKLASLNTLVGSLQSRNLVQR